MAFDEKLAQRIRRALDGRADVVEKKMFGGIAFMVSGRMACGVTSRDLMVRVGPERYEAALSRPHARPMDFTGRPLRGMVYVGPEGLRTDAVLEGWVAEAVLVATSSPKKPTPARSGRAAKARK